MVGHRLPVSSCPLREPDRLCSCWRDLLAVHTAGCSVRSLLCLPCFFLLGQRGFQIPDDRDECEELREEQLAAAAEEGAHAESRDEGRGGLVSSLSC